MLSLRQLCLRAEPQARDKRSKHTLMIIIHPEGGLSNRLRAIDSAIALAEKHEMKLHVIWERNRDCNCKFRDLFVVPNEFEHLTEIKRGLIVKILKRLAPIYLSIGKNRFLGKHQIEKLMNQRDGFESITNHNNIYISTFRRFYYPSSLPSYYWLRPKQIIQDKINSYKKLNMIGVHIRRTDNTLSVAHSPTSKFIESMNKEIASDGSVKFFLSTDDPSVEIKMRSIFTGKIVSYPKKSLDRNTSIAIHDAVIDLYCLSNCRKLIGSFGSSFSDLAADIKGIEKTTVMKSDA